MSGWVKLHRQLAEHSCFSDPSWVSVWIYLLIHATHKPRRAMFNGSLITLKPGQIITGRRVISKATGVNESKCKRILTLLESDQQIDRVRGSKSSLITIINWQSYQGVDQENDQHVTSSFASSGSDGCSKSGQQMTSRKSCKSARCIENDPLDDQQMTSKWPADDQQMTTVQEGKNERMKETLPASGDAVDEKRFYLTRKKRKLTGKRLESFERFWEAFAYPKGKAEAADAWLDIPEMTNAMVEEICRAAEAEARERPKLIAAGKTPKYAQGWLAGRRWEDEKTPDGQSNPIPFDRELEDLKQAGMQPWH